MTVAQEKILHETNSSVNKILGLLPGLQKIVHNNSDDIETLQRTTVKKNDKRNNWLMVKDILLIALASGSLILAFMIVGISNG